jgi:hypothetical protein
MNLFATFLLRKMDGRRLFSILLTFLVSLDLGDIIMILPYSLRQTLTSSYNYNNNHYSSSSDFRTINSNMNEDALSFSSRSSKNFRLLPFVGALEQEKIHVPGFLSSASGSGNSIHSLRSSDGGDQLRSVSLDAALEEINDKLLYRLTGNSAPLIV